MRRRSRPLTSDERRLWAQVARGVKPLKGRIADLEPVAEPPDPAVLRTSEPNRPGRATPGGLRTDVPPPAPLERRTVAALRRGRQGIDGVIDLHGLRQADAHRALHAFLRRSQAAGLTIVLVITGKGAAGADGAPFAERGVLRRVVPHWLRLPDVRPLVVGFGEAAPHHGGAGALYVRLRRPRGATTP